MQWLADALGEVGRVRTVLAEHRNRMFPGGIPKFNMSLDRNFNPVERPKTIADILVWG
ncbi:hypothetical protein [Sphingopyxis flava]|uniref:Uncharacterized protein n=1 Tax=Sphingopyxis flava TaxID=1507287 RepID=A0A1T5D7T4_9SPHN|nr:hypothetical protein [Sphingopyxis flava]SKB67686.1 hypothetical protein SAMN06295937_101349 [Sphingopyxis flava]